MSWQTRQRRKRGQASGWPTVATAAAWFVACTAATIVATGADRPQQVRRAAPPPTRWDKSTAGTFFDDAFSVLEGRRPAFETTAAQAGTPPDRPGEPSDSGAGFRWSTLVSEETLTDEVKDMKAVVAAASAKASDFKGGGYDEAREAFSTIALAFGVIAAYDQDVRWKRDAAAARDLFARVGFNCKVGTDQSLAETKARLEDLASLLDGGSPLGQPERDDDFRWSQAAARPALMARLGAAEESVGAGMASAGDFARQLERIVHDAEIMAAIGEVIQQPDFEYHDDDAYRGHASAMRDAALRIRDACRRKDYEAARTAAGDLTKSCAACHGEYRG
jgi:hypothetical protein